MVLMLAAEPTESTEPGPALQAEMHERLARAIQIQTAVINGDLDEARRWAATLADIAPDREVFADVTGRFGELAGEITRAETLAEAAMLTGELASACGACHELHEVPSWRFESETEPPGGQSVADRMSRHIWAADRLWEGLVARQDGAWAQGAETLTEPALAMDLIGEQAAQGLADQLAEFGREALQTVQWYDRAALYGRFLETCASCHTQFRNAKTGAGGG